MFAWLQSVPKIYTFGKHISADEFEYIQFLHTVINDILFNLVNFHYSSWNYELLTVNIVKRDSNGSFESLQEKTSKTEERKALHPRYEIETSEWVEHSKKLEFNKVPPT